MAASERVVVLMTREQKAQVSSRAKAAHLSLADYMRRQALGDDEMLTALLDELRESTTKATAALDKTLAVLDESERKRPELEAEARRRAIEEIEQWSPAEIRAVAAMFFAAPAGAAP